MPPRTWVLADDRAGNVAQALGVAEALGWPFERKDLGYDRWARLPNALRGASLLGVTAAGRAGLAPPWPDLVIAAGRRTAPVARWLRRRNPAARLVQVMDPGWPGRANFALIAIPNHDGAAPSDGTILRITGAPHRVTPARLATEAALWQPRLAHLPRPWTAVMVGGSTKSHAFTAEHARLLGEQVARLVAATGGSLLITTSRRTGPDAAAALEPLLPEPRAWFRWGDAGDNPYYGYLALADRIVVTGDSVSMVCEACAAPAPLLIFAPPGMVAAKHARLHAELLAKGLAGRLDAPGAAAAHAPLNAAADVAARIVAMMAAP